MIGKPSEKEEEYFKRQELAKLRKARLEAAVRLAEEEKKRLKELHWMCCPKCGLELQEVEYRGVMVDTCFGCGGTFFDRGEVEKVIEADERGLLVRLGSFLFSGEAKPD
jgi:hypothetical protein